MMKKQDFNELAAKKVLEANVLNLITVYTRDTDLNEEQFAAYTVGDVIREPYIVDVTYRTKGMYGNTRYAIFSNIAQDMNLLEKAPTWGLYSIKGGSRFKVINKMTHEDKNLIVLLQLPDTEEIWTKFVDACPVKPDDYLLKAVQSSFLENCNKTPLKDLQQPEWLERCVFPIGLDDDCCKIPLNYDETGI